MAREDFKQHRRGVVADMSGIGLEIGFGSGLNLPYYRNITKLFALEPSRELFELAQKNISAVSFPVEQVQASAEQILLCDGSVDFVVSTWSLCSIPCPEIALKEVARVLKPGGTFSFIDHGRSPKPSISMLQTVLTPVTRCCAGGCHLNRDVEQLVVNAGFKIQKLEKFVINSKPLIFMYKGSAVFEA